MGEVAKRHVRRVLRQLCYPFEFREDVHGGLRLRHLSLQQFRASVPPFARRGPSGRFPRLTARTAALRLPVALRRGASLPSRSSTSLAHPTRPRRRRDLSGSWTTLTHVPCSQTPVEPPRRTFGRCHAAGASVLPSALKTASA